ncbi:MAG: hypothetical protein GF417_11335 [Candidatus Latescibacteria bacterium]|nr:hypothetical protein [bacterium]MBD3425019.1 hypothetical protein [Candidatus Latescibacterota bacterium]
MPQFIRSRRFSPLFVILLTALLAVQCKPSGAPTALEDGDSIRVRFSLQPEEVLRYKGASTTEMNFYGMEIRNVHTDEITMTMREKTEEGNFTIRIKFDKSSDQLIRSGEMYEQSNPVKPEGRTVEVDITPTGEIDQARGVIPGLQDGGLKDYLSKWFAELPENAVAVGQSWEEDTSDSTENVKMEGSFTMTLKGIGEEKGIRVGYMTGTGVITVLQETAAGEINGESSADIEAAVALDGGYVVNYKVESDFSGTMTGVNPQTAKKESTEVSRSSYTTVDLLR